MLSIDPVDRLSNITTEFPSKLSLSAKWLPTKPAPPVINIFLPMMNDSCYNEAISDHID